jgi:hypothetical protein
MSCFSRFSTTRLAFVWVIAMRPHGAGSTAADNMSPLEASTLNYKHNTALILPRNEIIIMVRRIEPRDENGSPA